MALVIEQLTIYYDKTPVVLDLSLAIPEGQLVGVIGPNGSGKTTFLKACAGVVRPISGDIKIFSQPLKKVKSRIVYVPQRESIDWNFPITAFELVLMGRYGKLGPLKWPRKADKEAALLALEEVGMAGFADRQIGKLSGGQQQRLFIARALLQEGDLYLLDEPFAAIDLATEKVLVKLLQKLKKEKKTVLVVHHDLGTVPEYFDYLIMLNTCLVEAGPVKEVFTRENLKRTYGSSPAILEEALRLESQISRGEV